MKLVRKSAIHWPLCRSTLFSVALEKLILQNNGKTTDGRVSTTRAIKQIKLKTELSATYQSNDFISFWRPFSIILSSHHDLLIPLNYKSLLGKLS